MINKTNGHLSISSEIELGPYDSYEKIDSLKLGEAQRTSDMTNGYKWLHVGNVKVREEYYNLSFCFFNEELIMLTFIVDDNKFDLSKNFWDTWDEVEERNKALKYKQWLISELGSAGQFSWGQVSADYDPRGGSSGISIKYDLVKKNTFPVR
jgi:hypothetical protein